MNSMELIPAQSGNTLMEVSCARCAGLQQIEPGDSQAHCNACGLHLMMPRHDPILHDNCWQARADEFAVVLKLSQMQGIFRKALQVPPGTRAYIVQQGRSVEVAPGEYELEGFFNRLNHLLRDQAADILITRDAPFALDFVFTDLPCAEFLPLQAKFSLSLSLQQIAAFARHFMLQPGLITRQDLQQLLAAPVRQVAAEFLGARSLQDLLNLAGQQDLRLQLNERLQAMLSLQLSQFGLGLMQVDTLQLSHSRYDQARHKLGEISLLLAAEQDKLQLQKQINSLYDSRAWQEVEHKAAQEKLRIEQQLQQEQVQEQGSSQRQLAQHERSLQHAEKMLVLRARKIELLGRILQSENEEQALRNGAHEALRSLQQEMAGKAVARAQTAANWQQTRALAEIKMRAELEMAQHSAHEQSRLQQLQFRAQVAQLQWQHQARHLDEVCAHGQRQALQRRAHLLQMQAAEFERRMQLQEFQGQLALQRMQAQIRQQELHNILTWEQALQQQKLAQVGRDEALLDARHGLQVAQVEQEVQSLHSRGRAEDIAQHHTSLRSALALKAEFEQQQMHIRQQEEDMRWQRQQAQAAETARQEMTRMGVIGNLDDMSKLAVAPVANATLLAEVMKSKMQSGQE